MSDKELMENIKEIAGMKENLKNACAGIEEIKAENTRQWTAIEKNGNFIFWLKGGLAAFGGLGAITGIVLVIRSL